MLRILMQGSIAIGVIGLLFGSFCAVGDGRLERLEMQTGGLAQLPGAAEFPNADAVIVLDEGRLEILSVGSMPLSVFERHRIVKILNSRGSRYAFITIPYTPQSQVKNIRACTITANGDILRLAKNEIFDVNLYPEFVFYSDQRAKRFTLPAVEAGSVIDVSYTIELRSHTLWPIWNFQDYSPTLKSRFTLSVPSEWEIKHQLHHLNIVPSISKAPAGFKSSYCWEAQDIPPLRPEYGMPALNDCLARLEIAPAGMNNWGDVAAWFHELAEPQLSVTKAIRSQVLEIIALAANPTEKLKNIFEWVRDHIRYVAVEIGIGSYQPHPADQVLGNRYGDCKDMVGLICSMARAAGIEVYPALISTWQNGVADTSLPSPQQFNHAIAYAPNIGVNGTWMDATDKGGPWGQLPWYDQGLLALVIEKNGSGKILSTPKLPADSNRVVLKWRVRLDSTGYAEVVGSTELTGTAAAEIRNLLHYLPRDLQRNWLETDLASRCPGLHLDSMAIAGSRPQAGPLIFSYAFHGGAFSAVCNQRMSVRPGQILAFDLPNYFRAQRREHPIQWRGGTYSELNVVIELPAHFDLITPFWSDSLSSPFGYAAWKTSRNNGQLGIQIRYRLNGERVLPDQFPAFQKFIDQIQQRNLQDILISRNEQLSLIRFDANDTPISIQKHLSAANGFQLNFVAASAAIDPH